MSLVPTESGEATPFDPFLLIPIGGAIRSVSAPLSNILSGQTRKVITEASKLTGRQIVLPKSNILGNLFKSTKTKVGAGAAAGGATVANVIPKTTLSTATKAAITAGSIATTAGLITLTPTGQQISQDAGQIGKDFSGFIQQNGQLLSIFLIIGGAALLIGAIKK